MSRYLESIEKLRAAKKRFADRSYKEVYDTSIPIDEKRSKSNERQKTILMYELAQNRLAQKLFQKNLKTAIRKRLNLIVSIIAKSDKLFESAMAYDGLKTEQRRELFQNLADGLREYLNIDAPLKIVMIHDEEQSGLMGNTLLLSEIFDGITSLDQQLKVFNHEFEHFLDDFAPGRGFLPQEIKNVRIKGFPSENKLMDMVYREDPYEYVAYALSDATKNMKQKIIKARQSYIVQSNLSMGNLATNY